MDNIQKQHYLMNSIRVNSSWAPKLCLVLFFYVCASIILLILICEWENTILLSLVAFIICLLTSSINFEKKFIRCYGLKGKSVCFYINYLLIVTCEIKVMSLMGYPSLWLHFNYPFVFKKFFGLLPWVKIKPICSINHMLCKCIDRIQP